MKPASPEAPPGLLADAELLASEAVANAKMNRGRGLAGANSYGRSLAFDIGAFLAERVSANGCAVWYDACCGEGRALMEAAEQFSRSDWGWRVTLAGADLIGDFAPHFHPRLTLAAADVLRYEPPTPVDLCTVVHGLHYLGDKLAFLEHACRLLAPGGVLVGHLDPADLRLPDGETWQGLMRRVRRAGVRISHRAGLLRIDQTTAPLAFGLVYRGAEPSTAPNFSGMCGVRSWYAVP